MAFGVIGIYGLVFIRTLNLQITFFKTPSCTRRLKRYKHFQDSPLKNHLSLDHRISDMETAGPAEFPQAS
jgi:hypothetical protein